MRLVGQESFWTRFRKALKAKGLPHTQTAAADYAKVTQATISGVWSKRDRGPELEKGIWLAKKLGVCVEWLYTGRGDMTPSASLDASAQELMSVWDKLDDEAKRTIIGWAIGRASGIGEGHPFVKSPAATPRPTKATS